MAKKVELSYNFYYLLLFRAVSDFVKQNDPSRRVDLIARYFFALWARKKTNERSSDPSKHPPEPVLDTSTIGGLMALKMEMAAYHYLRFNNCFPPFEGTAPIIGNTICGVEANMSLCVPPSMCLRQALSAKFEMTRARRILKQTIETGLIPQSAQYEPPLEEK